MTFADLLCNEQLELFWSCKGRERGWELIVPLVGLDPDAGDFWEEGIQMFQLSVCDVEAKIHDNGESVVCWR